MYKVGKFKGLEVIKREGLVAEIHDHTEEGRLNEGHLDTDNKKMDIKEGKGVYVVTDEFGLVVNDKVLTNLDVVFVDGGALVHLREGKLVIEGKIIEADGTEKAIDDEKVDTVYVDSLRVTLNSIMKHKYKLTKEEEVKAHVDNLLFTMEVYSNVPIMKATTTGGIDVTANSTVKHTKLLSWSEVLGLGEFKFNKEEA